MSILTKMCVPWWTALLAVYILQRHLQYLSGEYLYVSNVLWVFGLWKAFTLASPAMYYLAGCAYTIFYSVIYYAEMRQSDLMPDRDDLKLWFDHCMAKWYAEIPVPDGAD